MWAISRVSCLLALWLCAACTSEPAATPSYLLGVWQTKAEGYTDQEMFIDEHRIGFGASADTADRYVITQIEERREGAKRLFVVSYQGADRTKFRLAFFYNPSGDGTIVYKNQDHLVWTRRAAAS
ncbi:MAG: hypothetical protein H8K05_14190 [Nitrospira sp.]|nr:hypothetical protein [Nitrospira sp.]